VNRKPGRGEPERIIRRGSWGFKVRVDWIMTRRVLSAAALAAAAASLAACSPGADYPSVLDKPTPRADIMSPDQVKQATDALISDREHLSAEVGAGQPNAMPGNTGGATVQPVSATGSTRTAGAATKP